MAAKYGKVRVAEVLLERGAHPNAAGKVSPNLLPLSGEEPGQGIVKGTSRLSPACPSCEGQLCGENDLLHRPAAYSGRGCRLCCPTGPRRDEEVALGRPALPFVTSDQDLFWNAF